MPHYIINERPEKSLESRSADEFVFKSNVRQSLAQTTLLQRALAFAEACLISYLPESQFQQAANKIGWQLRMSLTSSHGRCFLMETETDTLVLFRGSSEKDWEEIGSEEKAAAIFGETIGTVQKCFKKDVDKIWPQLEKELESNQKPLWFTGHSLGGALAVICANRCLLSYIRSEPEELHTFGCPRVGSKKYVRNINLNHYRWVNNNDYVTRVPPAVAGYRHCGQEMHIDHTGQLRDIGWGERSLNNTLCLIRNRLTNDRRDAQEHSIIRYFDRIFALARNEKPEKTKN